jgi:PAS domain S-box-containing protein
METTLSNIEDDRLPLREWWSGPGAALLDPLLSRIVALLGTSVAVFDAHGGLVSSTSQSDYPGLLADAPRPASAASPLRRYHELSWTMAASPAIETRQACGSGPCPGGLLRHAEPIVSGLTPVGAIVITFGDPPSDDTGLQRAADYYGADLVSLQRARAAFQPPSAAVVESAKHLLAAVAPLIAALWNQDRESKKDLALAREQIAALEISNSELRSAQTRVRSNRDYLRSILDSFPYPGMIVDSDLRVTDANAAFLSHVGEIHDQVVGRRCQALPHSRGAALCQGPDGPCPAEQTWRTGRATTALHTCRDDYGGERNISVEASPLLDRRGRMTAVIEIFRDVTEENRLTSTVRAINRLGQQLILTRDVPEIARAVVTAARQMLRFEVCALLLDQNGHLVVVASEGYAPSVFDFSLPVTSEIGITAAVARSGTAIYLPDVRQDSRYVVGAGYQALSELCVPLKAAGQIMGVLNVESDVLDAFDAASQQNLTILADVAAVALDSARAYRSAQQRAAEMTALFQLGAALLTERDPAAIAERIILELGDLVGVGTAVVGVVNHESDDLIIYGLDSGRPIPPTQLALDGESLTAYVVRTGSALRIDDMDTADLPVPGVQMGEPVRSWLGVPLRVQERVIGSLSIQSAHPDTFGPHEELLLTQIASQVAPVLDNARLYRQTRLRMSELETLFSVTASLSSDLSLDTLIDTVSRELAEAIDVSSCAISQWDEAAGTVTAIAEYIRPVDNEPGYAGQDLGKSYDLALFPATLATLLANHPITAYIDDPESDSHERALLREYGWSGVLALPMVAHGQVMGLVELYDARPERRFTPRDIRLAQTTANQAAIALRHAQLFNETVRQLEREEQLNQIAHALAGEMELETLIPRMLPLMTQLIKADAGTVQLVDLDQQLITRSYYYNLPQMASVDGTPIRHGVAREAMTQRRSVLLEDYQTYASAQQPWIDCGIRTALSVPLSVQQRIVGVLGLFTINDTRAFGAGAISAAEAAAQLAAVAIERARLFEAEQQRRREAEILRETSLALGTVRDPDQILERLLDQVSRILPYDYASIMWVEGGAARITHLRGFEQDGVAEEAANLRLPVKQTPNLHRMFTTLRPHVIPDTSSDPGWINLRPTSLARSWAGAPIIVLGEAVGFMALHSKTPGAYSSEHVELLSAFAAHAAIAIENIHLLEAEQRRAEEMAALNRITRGLSSGLTLPQLFQRFAADLKTVVPCDGASIALADNPAEPEKLIMHAIHDRPDAPLDEGVTMPLSASAATDDLLAGRPHLTDDLAKELNFPAARMLFDNGFRSQVTMPLLTRGQVIGALNLVSRRPGAFSARQLPLLQQIADAAASSLENVQLYQAAHLHADQLEREVSKRTAELQSERDQTQAILDSAAEGVIVTDLDGRILYVNPAMEQLTGYPADEVIGRNPNLWASGTHDDAFFQQMWQTALKGRVWEGELVNRRRDGTPYDAMLTVAPIPGPDGQPVGFVGIQADISQLKELERMKDRFVSNVSHELRTPITNLNLYLNLLEKGPLEKRDKYMATLRREVKRLYQLIEDLLSLSRLDVGSVQLNLIPMDVSQPAAQLVRDRMALAGYQGLILSDELAPDLPLAMADEKMLTQVITNLMTNAMNYTPAGGVVVVRTALRRLEGADWVTITVQDTGYGISAEDQAHLFERFFRGRAAQETGAPGTGLGLAICKEIIDRHQGRITAESRLGEGSEFTVWLPALPGNAGPG